MLLIATAAWAASFTLAKDAGHALNVLSGSPDDAFFGPTMLQGVRFLLAVSHVVRLENAWRMTAGQFAVAGLICLIPAYASHPLSPTSILPLILHANVLYPLLVILALPTFVAFTLMSLYQPKVDPTRAALIYQAEPVFAAALDFALKGRGLLPIELLGCAFILAANLTAELLPALKSERAED
jgi:drug/metabolite transporter (DMT)-like permease